MSANHRRHRIGPDIRAVNGRQRRQMVGSRLLLHVRVYLLDYMTGIVGQLVALVVHLDTEVDHLALALLALLDHLE